MVEKISNSDRRLDRVLTDTFSKVYFRVWKVNGEVRNLFSREILPSLWSGEQRSQAEDSKILLKPFEKHIVGLENIPESRPLLVIANHWNEGPYRNFWTHLFVSEAVDARRGQDVRWIMQDKLFIPHTTIEFPYSTDFCELFARSYNLLPVSPPVIRQGQNGGSVEQALRIARSFASGEVVGLYPEAKRSVNLREGHYLAGAISLQLARIRPEGLICPVGLYSQKVAGRHVLHANIGEAFPAGELLKFEPVPKDEGEKRRTLVRVANSLMGKINPLVPEKHRNPQFS